MKKYLYLTLLTTLFLIFVIYTNYNPSKKGVEKLIHKEKEAKKRDRPDLAAAQEFEMTKDPALGYPPTDRKIKAFETTHSFLRKRDRAKAITNVSWEERGPDNVGGRTRALMFDPNDASGNKVWAGAVAGGIWYNDDITDPDSRWKNVDDFMANLGISTIAHDPSNTNTFYAGTGLAFSGDVRGAGIWKSENGGETWAHLSSTGTDDFHYTQKIVITSASKLVAATLAGIQVSTNGGDSWTSTFEAKITDLNLASDGTLYASDYSGNIYKSTDAAENWESILSGAGGQRVELASAPSNPDVLYAVSEDDNRRDIGWFKKTSDGGDNWDDLTIPNYFSFDCSQSNSDFARGQAFFDLILSVYPDDANAVIVGGIDLYRSSDGGSNWQLLSYWTGACADYVHADQHAITFKPGNNSTALFGNDGGVFYSDNLKDATPEFHERIKGYNTALFYSCAATNAPLSNVYLAGAQDNGMHKFSNAGINSTQEVTGGDGGFSFIDQDNPNVMISSYVYNTYHRSLDGGASFSTFSDDTDNGRFINPCDYDDDADILYAAYGNNTMVVHSNISGQAVASSTKSISIGGDKATHFRTSPYTENCIFVGSGNGGVYRVDNANTQPETTALSNGQLPNGYISCIEIGKNDDHLLAILSNYGVISVWETTDGGENWSNKEGNLPDMPIKWALYNPANRNEVLLATEFGIWSTDNILVEQPDWEPTVEGLANVKCNMLQYRESDQQVIVATFGRGLFTTNVFTKDIHVEFTSTHTVSYIGKEIEFSKSSVGPINDYRWDFGDGNSSVTESPVHIYESPGSYTVELTVNNGDKTVKKTNYITVLPDREGDYSADEGGDFDTFTDDFVAHNIGGTPFELGKSEIKGKQSTASGDNAWVTGLTDENYVNNSTALLYTPHFDFSNAGNYTLSFKTNYAFEDEWDGFIVQYTLDSGNTWTKLNDQQIANWYNTISDPQSVFGASVPIFSGNTGEEYQTKNTDVSFLQGNSRVGFRFVFRSDAAEIDAGMAIDDFEISGPQANAVPDFAISATGTQLCTGSKIIFHDRSAGSVASYSWDFGDDATPATAEGRGPHEVTYSSAGDKNISLTVDGTVNGTQTETKTDYLSITSSSVNEKTVTAEISEICINESSKIKVESTEQGFTYQLFRSADNSALSKAKEGNSGTLEFEIGSLTETTLFYIEARNTLSSCSAILADQPEITVTPAPHDKVSLLNTKVCVGEVINITVENSQSGVTYNIYSITDEKAISDDMTSDGGDITLTSHAITDGIEVEVIATSGKCNITSESMSIDVKPVPTPEISAEGATLISSETVGSFQWFLDGEPINNATTSIIQVNALGEYTVEVTQDGCTAVSPSFTATVLGLNELLQSGELEVYPNPTSGTLYINQTAEFTRMRIYNSIGQILLSKENISKNEILPLSHLLPGQYILELSGPKENMKMNIQKR